MPQPIIADELRFNAEYVAGRQEAFTPDFTVHGINFGEGDPEHGGQHWNFTRSLDDHDGVCTAKEIQQVVVYSGIRAFRLVREVSMCEFDDATARQTGTRRLIISYTIDDQTWQVLVQQAQQVLAGEMSFRIID